jgi:hypothetical protein
MGDLLIVEVISNNKFDFEDGQIVKIWIDLFDSGYYCVDVSSEHVKYSGSIIHRDFIDLPSNGF